MSDPLEIRIVGRNEAGAPLKEAENQVIGFGDIARGVFAGNLMTKAFDTFLGGIRSVGDAFVGVFRGMGDAVAGWVTEAANAQIVGVQTDAVLRSTQNAAGLTRDAIEDLALAFQKQTTFEDDAIQSAENVLLRFTKIGSEVFPAATEAVLNMAAAMAEGAIPTGEQLTSVALMVGKALDGDTAILTGLQRQGVSFNQTELDMIAGLIEAGRVTEAQMIILGRLDEKFGGTAEMMGTTALGAVERLRVGWRNMGEDLGNVLLPGITDFLNTTVNAFTSDQLQGAWTAFVNGIKRTIDPIFTRLATQFKETARLITNAISTGNWSAAIDAMIDFIVGRDGVIASVGGLITNFGRKMIDALRTEWPRIKSAISPWATEFWNWLSGPGGALDKAGEYVKKLMDWFMQKLNEYVQSESFQNGLRQIGLSISKAILDVIAPINPLAGVSSVAIGGFQTLTAGTSTPTPTNPTSAPQASAQWQMAGTQSEALNQYNAFLRRRQQADTADEIYTADQGISFWKNRLHELGVAGFQHGGVVPGPMGKPQLAVVHGGEEIVPPATNIYVTANYRNYQSESSLRDDLRLLQRLGATV